jgi:hypothetical protein
MLPCRQTIGTTSLLVHSLASSPPASRTDNISVLWPLKPPTSLMPRGHSVSRVLTIILHLAYHSITHCKDRRTQRAMGVPVTWNFLATRRGGKKMGKWSEAGSRPIVWRAGSPTVEAASHFRYSNIILCMYPGGGISAHG